MVKIYISFRQNNSSFYSVHKTIELPIVPPPNSYFEYEDGWGLARLAPTSEQGMHLEVTRQGVAISGYGPQFDQEEIDSLKELGWEVL